MQRGLWAMHHYKGGAHMLAARTMPRSAFRSRRDTLREVAARLATSSRGRASTWLGCSLALRPGRLPSTAICLSSAYTQDFRYPAKLIQVALAGCYMSQPPQQLQSVIYSWHWPECSMTRPPPQHSHLSQQRLLPALVMSCRPAQVSLAVCSVQRAEVAEAGGQERNSSNSARCANKHLPKAGCTSGQYASRVCLNSAA